MNFRPLLILPPIVLGVAGFLWMTADRGGDPLPQPEAELAVRVEQVSLRDVSPVAIGYGRVQAVHDWSAISESQGRIAMVAPGLAVGRNVEENELLLSVDKADYQLTLDITEANILAARARLAELDRQEKNTETSLAMEQRVLEVAQSEFERIEGLVARGTSTQASLDAQAKVLLKQQQAVTSLQNTQALYPSQQKSAKATLAVRLSEFAEAERAMAKTEIRAPLRGRVSAVAVEQGQFVRVGESLLSIEGSAAAEVVAEVQPIEFRKVVVAAKPGFDELDDVSQVIAHLEQLGVRAEIRMDVSGINAVWPAEMTRMRGTLDSTTGTLGLVVEVAQPNSFGALNNRPPLTVGAFVSVAFVGPDWKDVIAVPRDSLRYDDDGAAFVFLSDAESRLRKQMVDAGMVHGDRVIIRDGLAVGDRVVLSDPRPPVEGLRLIPVIADSLTQEQ